MTIEYLVLGILLIIMGVVQIWLRRGLAAEQDRMAATEGASEGDEQQAGDERQVPALSGTGKVRSGPLWQAWTRILGYVGILLGIALIIVGALGR